MPPTSLAFMHNDERALEDQVLQLLGAHGPGSLLIVSVGEARADGPIPDVETAAR